VTSPNDPLSDIFSQIAAQDSVDPAVFDQSLEAAFDYDGTGFDELVPSGDDSATDVDDSDGDLLVGDPDDAFYETDDTDTDADTDNSDPSDFIDTTDDFTAGDDLII
jgi:hypothetical protein